MNHSKANFVSSAAPVRGKLPNLQSNSCLSNFFLWLSLFATHFITSHTLPCLEEVSPSKGLAVRTISGLQIAAMCSSTHSEPISKSLSPTLGHLSNNQTHPPVPPQKTHTHIILDIPFSGNKVSNTVIQKASSQFCSELGSNRHRPERSIGTINL